ncbi:hypothetical protein M406DRAFT_330544 [Cryphonectria parasitica EP155]|uniref:Uncharacterized protein n=1 Tax=Cryphonectria parasitica (strain ATCC 38755 / EP155) TaxID=660469 RepID=A0A9P5CMB4_CRYP1|nr:uncharacterized protein M406DRAFT_330544 [Cryphonectria parasitica EP155]KAF3764194.1 hypothetical protein M406DRAFT_330544 [Cryphonectria parasitica EP155]
MKVKSFPRLRPHLRHVHIPDLPPLYAPRFIPANIRDYLESQILQQRQTAEQDSDAGASPDPNSILRDYESQRTWLRKASPPPTVLSFTRRPTYILPKSILEPQSSSAVNRVTESLRNQIRITFPEPPGWQSTPWRPLWDMDKEEQELTHNPLDHEWDPSVAIMPCAEPMFFGPGQLSLWPVIDVQDQIQATSPILTRDEFVRILERTTIKVLRRNYGIKSFAIPGSPGVWVESALPSCSERSDLNGHSKRTAPQRNENIRRIATIHAEIVNNITRFGTSIHVGQPWPAADASKDMNNPWARLGQADITTSIAAELAHMNPRPQLFCLKQETILEQDENGEEKKQWMPWNNLTTLFSDEAVDGVEATPYSQVLLRPGLTQPAPMGLDNRDLSASWACAFARQLGMRHGVVDYLSIVQPGSGLKTNLTTSDRDVGFTSRAVGEGFWHNAPSDQVEVPTIQLKENELVKQQMIQDTLRVASKDSQLVPSIAEPIAVSWPMYYKELTRILDLSIRGNLLDTRLRQLVQEELEDMKVKKTRKPLTESMTMVQSMAELRRQRAVQLPRAYTDTIGVPDIAITRETYAIARYTQATNTR